MKRIKREDEKGAMGIGTLIIFIAMVLVAAVAASVLISTAYDLQQQAQQTGDEAIREVSTSFVVKDVYGTDTNSTPDGDLENITMKLGLAAGAPDQDLNQTVMEIDDGTNESTLEGQSSADGAHYGYAEGIEQEGTFNSIVEAGDTVIITINVSQTTGVLGPQEDVTIKIMPKHGTPTLETFSTPPVINEKIIHLA